MTIVTDDDQVDDTACTPTCLRCRLRGMLTAAVTGDDRKRLLKALRHQFHRGIKAARVLAAASGTTECGRAVISESVEELIVVCDRVYQVAAGDVEDND